MSTNGNNPNLGMPSPDSRKSIENASTTGHPEGRGIAVSSDFLITKTELRAENETRKERGEEPLSKEKYLIARFFGENKDKVGLELGTSIGGVFMREASPYVAHMDGISNGITEEEVGNIESTCENCDVRLGDAATLPYEDNRFDFIFGVHIHRYFKQYESYKEAREYFLTVIKEIYRTLKPGGIAILAPALENPTFRLHVPSDVEQGGKNLDSPDFTEEERALLPEGLQIEVMKDQHVVAGIAGAGYKSSIRITKPA